MKQYEAPSLLLLGRIEAVVFGPPGLGLDGSYGFSTIWREYEEDTESSTSEFSTILRECERDAELSTRWLI